MAWSLPSDLSDTQSRLPVKESPPPGARLRKYTVVSVLNAADKGYRGASEHALPMSSHASLQCVRSDFGKSGFIPLEGRWVVERTFSRLGGRRRINCNYEQYLRTARQMTISACMMFMLRYF